MVNSNSILVFRAMNVGNIFPDFLQYVDKVKSFKEWKDTNIPLRINRASTNPIYFHPIIRNGDYYRFEIISNDLSCLFEDDQKNCFINDKRLTKRIIEIYYLVKQGVKLDEFYYFEESLYDYFEAVEYFENKKYALAHESIEKSIVKNPREEYLELKDNCNIELHNTNTAKSLFEKYRNRIHHAVHSEDVYKWIRCFLIAKEYSTALEYFKITINWLESLSRNKNLNGDKIEVQNPEEFDYYKKKFTSNLNKSFKNFKWKSELKTDSLIDLLKYVNSVYTGENDSFKINVNNFI